MATKTLLAHSPDSAGNWHSLDIHLQETARLAGEFGAQFNMKATAALCGLLHDCGKAHPGWQHYLREAAAGRPVAGQDHKHAGALLAQALLRDEEIVTEVVLPILGHHSGIPNRTSVGNLTDFKATCDEHQATFAIKAWQATYPNLLAEARNLAVQTANELRTWYAHTSDTKARCLIRESLIRMLQSCLVDADCLDTGEHFRPGLRQSGYRPTLASAANHFKQARSALVAEQRQTPLNAERERLYQYAVAQACADPGYFILALPTGAGKTLASLGAALRHAVTHGKSRIITAVPYITVTDQTAAVYQQVLPAGSVIEHHSGATNSSSLQDRLAAENWDSPIVVTTTVQLLESLHRNRTTKTRKLHNLANSIIVLDEVQAIPQHMLEPTFTMLNELVNNYGVTVILSTATQPNYQLTPFLAQAGTGTHLHPPGVFTNPLFVRVNYNYALTTAMTPATLADKVEAEFDVSALVVVNTRSGANAMYEQFTQRTPGNAFHLSTSMCQIHRNDVLRTVRARLQSGQETVLVSTQLIEAGIDVDFRTGYRQHAPLESVIQAGGRINREGGCADARVTVFDFTTDLKGLQLKDRYYQDGRVAAATVMAEGTTRDPLSVFGDYWNILHNRSAGSGIGNCYDIRDVMTSRRYLNFVETADRYRLIEDDGPLTVWVSYGPPTHLHQQHTLLNRLADGTGGSADWRAIGTNLVRLPGWRSQELIKAGAATPVGTTGLYRWVHHYSDKTGTVLPEPGQTNVEETIL